jgi:PBP1b-binding outer membrane lipoprotein LpoB
MRKVSVVAAAGLLALGLSGCTQEEVDAKIEQAKVFAGQVVKVASAVCNATPEQAALANAVMGMVPTPVNLATVATTVCVWVKTPKSTMALVDPCPGGVFVNDVCVPVAKD